MTMSHILLRISFFFLLIVNPLFSVPDLTIVGFVDPDDGLGKVPITILETLGDKISANFINSNWHYSLEKPVPSSVINALHNPDKSPGKVALLTDLIWNVQRTPSASLPKSIVKLAYSMLETTLIPSKWVKLLNEEFDAVVVPDKYLVSVYKQSGVKIPIFVLPIPMMLKPYYDVPPHLPSRSSPFVFGDASANKNPANLIEAFAKAFGNSQDVALVMRAGRLMHETRQTISELTALYGLMNVQVEEGHIPLDQYINRLSSFDCYVNLSRGEGFSFIPREALALGIPVIIANNTASTTICNSGFVRAVPCYKKGPANSIYQAIFQESCGEQFDCDVNDVVTALLDVYNNYQDYIAKARNGRKWVDRYNTTNPKLQDLYYTLIKPKKILIGNKNTIKNGVIMTTSPKLYKKYRQIISADK